MRSAWSRRFFGRARYGLALCPLALSACEPARPAASATCTDCSDPGAPGARLRIVHRYDMGPRFEVVGISYALDGGAPSSRPISEPGGPPPEEIPATPGAHRIDVRIRYRGRQDSSIAGYRFELATWHNVALERGKVTEVALVEFERGLVPLAEAPAARWRDH